MELGRENTELTMPSPVEELTGATTATPLEVTRLDIRMQDLPAVDRLSLEPPAAADPPATAAQEPPPAEEAAASADSSAPLAFDLPLASTEDMVSKMMDNIFKNVYQTLETNEVMGRIGKMQIKEQPKRYSPYSRGGAG